MEELPPQGSLSPAPSSTGAHESEPAASVSASKARQSQLIPGAVYHELVDRAPGDLEDS